MRVTMRSRVEKYESSGSALGVLWECSESFMRALRVYLGLYLIFQANLADCMRYSLRNGGLPRRQIWIWRVFWYCGVGKLAPLGSHHIFCTRGPLAATPRDGTWVSVRGRAQPRTFAVGTHPALQGPVCRTHQSRHRPWEGGAFC